MILVEVKTFAATHVAHCWQIPFLYRFSCSCVKQYLCQHVGGVLLYGECLKTRTLRVDVRRTVSVSMTDACVI